MNKTVKFEVIGGPEGACLAIMDADGGQRIAGPKPWGGGHTMHTFSVDLDELIEAATSYAQDQE